MAAIVASNFAVAAPSKVAARKNIARKSALPVKRSVAVKAVRKQQVVASTKLEKMTAAATAASAAALANPLVAEAAVTPSLKNTLLSVVAGGLVLGAIAAAVIGVSTFDKVSRK